MKIFEILTFQLKTSARLKSTPQKYRAFHCGMYCLATKKRRCFDALTHALKDHKWYAPYKRARNCRTKKRRRRTAPGNATLQSMLHSQVPTGTRFCSVNIGVDRPGRIRKTDPEPNGKHIFAESGLCHVLLQKSKEVPDLVGNISSAEKLLQARATKIAFCVMETSVSLNMASAALTNVFKDRRWYAPQRPLPH